MNNEAPWSVKGVDSETRKQLKEIAQETGVTLGELIGTLVSQQAQGGKKLKSPLKAEARKIDSALDEEVKTTRRKRTTTRKATTKTTAKKTAPRKVAPKKAPTRRKTTTVKKAAPKSSSVFESLLNQTDMPRTKSARRSSKASVSMSKMPQDDLHELVVEGRELRDALRAHTRELSKEIQSKVEKSITSQIADIKSYVSHSSAEGEALPKSHERTSIFLQEAQNLIDESLSSHLDEVKNLISGQSSHMALAGHSENPEALHQEVQTIMEKVGQDILQSVDDKILALHTAQSLEANGQPFPVQELHNSLNSIIERLVSLEATCDNLQQSKSQGGYSGHEDLDKIHQELSHFMHTVPQQVKELIANSDNNIQSLHSSISDLAQRVEHVESYAQKIPMSAEQYAEETIMNMAASQETFSEPAQNFCEKVHEKQSLPQENMHSSAPEASQMEDNPFEEVSQMEDNPFEEVSQIEDNPFEEIAQAPMQTAEMPQQFQQEQPKQPPLQYQYQQAPAAPQMAEQYHQTPQQQENPFLEQDGNEFDEVEQNHNAHLEEHTLENYYDDETENLQSLEEHQNPSYEDENAFDEYYDDEDPQQQDAWDQEASYDELGFEQPENNPPHHTEKKNELNAGIKGIDYQAMMAKTRRDTINQLDQRAIDAKDKGKHSKQSKILSSLNEKTNQKNAIIVGSVALSIIALLTFAYLS